MTYNKITSFTAHQTAEGMRVTYTFSVIDENGDTLKSNARDTKVIMNEEILAAIQTISDFMLTKIPGQYRSV